MSAPDTARRSREGGKARRHALRPFFAVGLGLLHISGRAETARRHPDFFPSPAGAGLSHMDFSPFMSLSPASGERLGEGELEREKRRDIDRLSRRNTPSPSLSPETGERSMSKTGSFAIALPADGGRKERTATQRLSSACSMIEMCGRPAAGRRGRYEFERFRWHKVAVRAHRRRARDGRDGPRIRRA